MRTAIAALSIAAGIGLVCCQTAKAVSVDGAAIKLAAMNAATVQQAQYSERRTKRGLVKCYREFIVGRYECHTYRHW